MKRIPTLNITCWLNTVRFIDGKPTVYCRLTVQGKRTEMSLQRSIPRNQWSKGKALNTTQKGKDLNDYISLFKAYVLKVFNHMVAMDEDITTESLKKHLVGAEEEKRHSPVFIKDCFLNSNKKQKKETGPCVPTNVSKFLAINSFSSCRKKKSSQIFCLKK